MVSNLPPDPVSAEGPPPPTVEEAASLAGMISVAAESFAALLAGKLRLAGLELSRDLVTILVAAGFLVCSLLLVLLALGFAGAGAALLLGRMMGSPGAALLLVAGAYALAAVLALAVARTRLKRLRDFLKESRADFKRDLEWLKHPS